MTGLDLAAVTRAWGMQWWDPVAHMVWNPPGSVDANIEARQLHLVPNTAWLAYALLADDDEEVRGEGIAAVRALIDLQYDRPGTVVHGTYRRFLEWPEPPDDPVMWDDYDPNWRQFVGTTFAVILEDFGDRLDAGVVGEIERSIGFACTGEPDGRIPPSYSNPALMRAWLDGWYGRRTGDARLIDRGVAFAAAIVADFDRFGAFDEFNSPTYYGIDIYALRLWRTFPPDPYYAEQGARVEDALWRSAGDLYNASLRNFCGPFTRSYHPDANRSVTLLSLWLWALVGREHAPLPALDAPVVDHGHDLMAGPIFARLAGRPESDNLADFGGFRGTHTVSQELARGRRVSAWVGSSLMIGAEASDVDWGGWAQFMPATAHWSTPSGAATLWLVDAHVVRAVATENQLTIEAPVSSLRFRLLSTDPPIVEERAFSAAGMRASFSGTVEGVAVAPVAAETYDIEVTTGGDAAVDIRFTETSS